MIRFRSSLLTSLIAAAVLAGGAAPTFAATTASAWEDQAQPNPGNDRERPRGRRPSNDSGEQRPARRMISEAEARSRAERQARGAKWVGAQGLQGAFYVFLYEGPDGRTFPVRIPAYD